MTKPVKLFQSILPRKFIYCDVGARGGLEGHPWRDLASLIDTISFEPDDEEFQRLLKVMKEGSRVFKYALHRGSGQATLHLTKSRGCSSLYPPNPDFLQNFPELDRYSIEKDVTIQTISLDELSRQDGIDDIDFVKIDVQGAGLDVLKGSRNFLGSHILGVEIEVEFQPLYRGQALFADIDRFVHDIGFELMDLRKSYWKKKDGVGCGALQGQLIFGDALYMKPPDAVVAMCRDLDREERSAKICMACFMGVAYGYLDYMLSLLNHPELPSMLDDGLPAVLKKAALTYGKSIHFQFPGSRYLAEIFSILTCRNGPTQRWQRVETF